MGAHIKRCLNCGREDTKGFSNLSVQRLRFENGQAKQLPAPAIWVCRLGYGCEGIGPLHIFLERQ